jgi:hypothetical protein
MGLARHVKEFVRDIVNGNYERTHEGIIIRKGVCLDGYFQDAINGVVNPAEHNLVPDAAILAILNTFYGSTAKVAAWYIAPFSGSSSPASSWTAANFASNATEITSTSEGYTESTRQQCTFAAAAAGAVDNYASKAHFTIATASTLVVTGLGLISANTRGGTSGVLGSAIKFAVSRSLANGDDYQAGYQVTLAD